MSNTKLWAITIFVLVVGWLLYTIAPALQPALIALVFAYLLTPAVEFFQKQLRIPKWMSIILLLTIVIIILVVVGNLLFPLIAIQTRDFISEFDTLTKTSDELINNMFVYLEEVGLSETILDQLEQYYGMAIEWFSNFVVRTLTAIVGFIFKLIDVFLIIIMTIYFLASGKQMVATIVKHTPDGLHQSVLNLIEGTNTVVWNYARTQAIVALILGVMSTAAYLLIGLQYPILLGFIAGILSFIPYFGAITASVLATAIALLTEGMQFATITLAAVIIIQQLESNLITPRLQGKSIGLNPVAILILILIGNYLWGTVGMFIAVPVFGLVRLAFTEILKLIHDMD